MPSRVSSLVVAALAAAAHADVYMHNPRGSNNRLNERSANRNNGNRMFDSQNNNRGGYNKGDVDNTAAEGAFAKQYDMTYFESEPDATAEGGSSFMTIEWTNQHGCGGNEHGDPHKLNCDIILQYMCVPTMAADNGDDYLDRNANDLFNEARDAADRILPLPNTPNTDTPQGPNTADYACFKPNPAGNNPDCVPVNSTNSMTMRPCPVMDGLNSITCPLYGGLWRWSDYNADNAPAKGPNMAFTTLRRFRDGTTTNRQEFTNGANSENQVQRAARKIGDIAANRGLHESWEHYDECYRRERNRGLFTADQNLRNNAFGYSSAVYTRQNPNNNRRGYECPEERDHYPYWHPSPWVDIAVLTDRLDRCAFYQSESQNVKPKNACRKTERCPTCNRWNNEQKCNERGGRWVEVGAHEQPPPECLQAPWARVNHLGNGRYGQANSYNWTIPHFGNDMKCVVRLRYNISTDDYDGAKVNSSFNNNNGQGVQSPVRQNPNVDIGAFNTALRLAINTAQFGRTFQDRSHVINIKARPNASSSNSVVANRMRASKVSEDFYRGRNIYNLNVRGKRCNIVQCFPSVEYDFMPNHLTVKEADIVHIQWTGSNTHNNGNPAGDGQAGDAGEGTRGTDRHNFVELMNRNDNDFGASFPAPWSENTIMKNMLDAMSPEAWLQTLDSAEPSWDKIKENWAVRMATVGYYKGYKWNDAETKMIPDPRPNVANPNTGLNVLLNNAPASYPGGLFRFKKGRYNYMCTRNHNFSNRDQKGHLIVL